MRDSGVYSPSPANTASSPPSTQNNTSISSPQTPTGGGTNERTSGHKNSLKGTKLARRARSFKDDLFERISNIRTPTNTIGRAHSPHSPRNKHSSASQMKFFVSAEDKSKTSYQLELHEKHIRNALRHLCDVISKKKFEVLPGNGTVLLDLVTGLHAVLQNENSTPLIQCKTKMFYSLGKLIKFCDESLLNEDETDCSTLNTENVTALVEEVESAVQQLVQLGLEKAKEKEKEKNEQSQKNNNTLKPTVVDIAAQRTSLPDIPLTPKERDILEKSSSNPMRVSYSTESLLRDTSPPPKPPHPSNRSSNPPPLPPKRRSQNSQTSQNELNQYNNLIPAYDSISSGNNTIDHLSIRSRSPDDNSSLLSVSAGSLDSASVFNNSKDGLIIQASVDLDMDEYDKVFQISIDSMQSIRASMQSVSTKRSSEQSIHYQKSSMSSNSDISCTKRFESTKNFQEINDFHSSTSSMSTASTTLSQQNTIFTVSSGVIAQNNSLFEKQSSSSASASTSLSVSKTNSVDLCDGINNIINMISELDEPTKPLLPPKMNRINNRFMSQYDNFENKTDHESCANDEHPELRHHMSPVHNWQSKHQSLMDSKTCNNLTSFSSNNDENPPPLPLKRKHKASIIAYMEICSSSTRTTEQLRHSMHTFNISQSASENQFASRNQITHSQTMNLAPVTKSDLFPVEEDDKPPALPPKARQNPPPSPRVPPPTIITTPPPSPKPTLCSENYENRRIINSSMGNEMSTVTEVNEYIDDDGGVGFGNNNIITGIAGNTTDINNAPNNTNDCFVRINAIICPNEQINDEDVDHVVLRNPPSNNKEKPSSDDLNILEETDVTKYLIFNKNDEGNADVKGGYFDALLVYASQVSKGSEGEEGDAFAEAFISTFRTIVQPLEVVEKLTHRYTIFCSQVSDQKKKAAKETFSLLVRIVNDLTPFDLEGKLKKLLVEFVYQLVLSGQLQMAKLLRTKIVEKVQLNRQQLTYGSGFGDPPTRNIVTNQPTLFDLKSSDIAEQMTLIDAELFEKIEIPEVLLLAIIETLDDRTPNLAAFTEHFNKISFWIRSQILKQNDAKDREKYVIKCIKIMKHLRKMNNYNSYLALLSALDSAPIRRLEWHKTVTEGLNEYCSLIDSSSSFRTYRHALEETSPPCIPYLGLVLQDLTFVHVGNPDYLNKERTIVNFAKRWQQYNIIVNMKKFKKCTYPFRRNERIIGFFENFEDFLDEEQMWQISENIKPRGKRTV